MGLATSDISPAWVARVSSRQVHSFQLNELQTRQGVLSRYQPSTRDAIVGHRVLTVRDERGGEHDLVIKSKARGEVVRRRLEDTYRRYDPALADLQRALAPSILDDSHTRELAIYQLESRAFRAVSPSVMDVWRDDDAEIFVVVMERLVGVRHADTLADLSVWSPHDVAAVLSQIAGLHGEGLDMSPASPPPWLVPFSALHNQRLLEYQAGLIRYNADRFPDLFDAPRVARLEALLAASARRHQAIVGRPLTMIHGDFTPRNLCLKPGDRLCAYDWELAQVHLPQRDVVEFLCYVLDPERSWDDGAAAQLLERYRLALASSSRQSIDGGEFQSDVGLALAEFAVFKLLVQGITHQLLGQRTYFERLVHNAFRGLATFPLGGLG